MQLDPELLAAFRRGERTALERVYWACIGEVEGVVRHGVAKARLYGQGLGMSEVGDLVQETFARAFDERARLAYDGVRPYLPFLCTIARNLVLDVARKRGREITMAELEPADAPEPEVPWADPSTMRAVEAYLAELPPDLRAIHERRYVLGEAQEAAARALGISRQQLRTLEQRLLSGLARHLRNQEQRSPVGSSGVVTDE